MSSPKASFRKSDAVASLMADRQSNGPVLYYPDPTGTGDPDLLLLGDFNAYTHEDPLVALTSRGLVDLATSRGRANDHYSFGFDGMWGSLDHALASPSLAAQVRGVITWHVNADEPPVLGYETAFKTPAQQAVVVVKRWRGVTIVFIRIEHAVAIEVLPEEQVERGAVDQAEFVNGFKRRIFRAARRIDFTDR